MGGCGGTMTLRRREDLPLLPIIRSMRGKGERVCVHVAASRFLFWDTHPGVVPHSHGAALWCKRVTKWLSSPVWIVCMACISKGAVEWCGTVFRSREAPGGCYIQRNGRQTREQCRFSVEQRMRADLERDPPQCDSDWKFYFDPGRDVCARCR